MLRRLLPLCLTLTMTACNVSSPPATGSGGTRPVSVAAALQMCEDAGDRDEIQRAAAALEAALEKDPKNVPGLTLLARISQGLASHPEGDEATAPGFHKAADLVRRALAAQPDLVRDRDFRQMGAEILYDNARAWAREKNGAKALAELREAIAFGFSRLARLEKEKAFQDLRSTPEFARFLEEAPAKIKDVAAREVAGLLAENKPFDFDFDLEDVAGNSVSKAALRGQVAIVDIWGTWCPPCKMEIPHFVALDEEFHERGLRIVGLNDERTSDEARAARAVRTFLKAEGVTYPCAVISDEFLEQVPDMQGFPTTLFLDRTGTVRLKVTGYHEKVFLQAAVEALLDEKPGDVDGKSVRKPRD